MAAAVKDRSKAVEIILVTIQLSKITSLRLETWGDSEY